MALTQPDFARPIQIALPASAFTSECFWPPDQNWPEVVEWKAGAWIEVEGGAWTLAAPHVTAVRAGIQSFAESRLQANCRELHPWPEYLFQYQGRKTGATPYVYIKALYRTPADANLRKTFTEAGAGDACTFAATYDVTRDRFDSIEIGPFELK